jgi:hypothetical protein
MDLLLYLLLLAHTSSLNLILLCCCLVCSSRKLLQRRKKFGLLAAVNNVASELMLLSVATLMLTALAPAITRICTPAGNVYKPWLANVEGCACCLAKTKGVTPCFTEVPP